MSLNAFSVYTKFKAVDGMSGVFQSMKNRASMFGGQLGKLKSSVQTVGSNFKSTFDGMRGAVTGLVATVTAGAVANTLSNWVDKASDLQETLGKTNETFKDNAFSVVNWSKNSIKTMGLAQQTALDTAALYGDMGTGMGMTTKRASEMAMTLTQLSADLASFKNQDQTLMQNALKGIFTGETEALKNIGTVMTQENLQEFAKNLGIDKKIKDMSQTEKIELRFQYVMASTKNSQGDFLRTGENFANQSRIFEQNKIELETKLGAILLPKYNAVMKSLNTTIAKYSPAMIKGFGSMFEKFENGLKICMPLFEKFKNLFKTFNSIVMPAFRSSLPIIKVLLSTVIVPVLGLTIDTINILFKSLKFAYGFVKKYWLPLLIAALPIAITGVQMAIDTFKLHVTLAAMEGKTFTFWNTAMGMSLEKLKFSFFNGVKAIKMFGVAAKMAALNFVTFSAAVLTNPITWIVVGIAAVISAIVLLWKHWDKVVNFIKTSVEWLTTSTFGKLISCLFPFIGVIALIIKNWNTLKTTFINSVVTIGKFFKEHFIDILFAALNPIYTIIKGLGLLGSIISDIKNGKPIQLNWNNPPAIPPINTKTAQSQKGIGGVVEVKTVVENKNNSDIYTSASLIQPHNLQLKPL